MKNEIFEFFAKTGDNLEFILNDVKLILETGRMNDNRSFVLLNIIYEYLKEDKIDDLLGSIKSCLADLNFDEINLLILSNFIKEEKFSIVDYFNIVRIEKEESYPKLVDFEWKFITLSTLDNFEKGDLTPKILLKLKFNSGLEKIFETDFSNLKKLQEEIEENLSSFNSTYSRRIDTFAK